MLRYTLEALAENHPGVLARVANLISRRGFNIERLAIDPAGAADLARMTIVLSGALDQQEQVVRQLAKLVDILAVRALEADGAVACAAGAWDPRAPSAARAARGAGDTDHPGGPPLGADLPEPSTEVH